MTETPRTADEGLGPGEVRRVRADWQIADERPICPDPSAHAEAAQDAARQRDVAEDVAKAIGGFLWLANNLHNVDSPQFVGMFRAAAEDARPIYEKYAALLRATEGKQQP